MMGQKRKPEPSVKSGTGLHLSEKRSKINYVQSAFTSHNGMHVPLWRMGINHLGGDSSPVDVFFLCPRRNYTPI